MTRSGSSGKCHDKADPDHPKPRELRDIQCHLTAFPTPLGRRDPNDLLVYESASV